MERGSGVWGRVVRSYHLYVSVMSSSSDNMQLFSIIISLFYGLLSNFVALVLFFFFLSSMSVVSGAYNCLMLRVCACVCACLFVWPHLCAWVSLYVCFSVKLTSLPEHDECGFKSSQTKQKPSTAVTHLSGPGGCVLLSSLKMRLLKVTHQCPCPAVTDMQVCECVWFFFCSCCSCYWLGTFIVLFLVQVQCLEAGGKVIVLLYWDITVKAILTIVVLNQSEVIHCCYSC